jgi:hypothetical protein
MIAASQLSVWLGAYSMLVVFALAALALGSGISKRHRTPIPSQGAMPWFGLISFVLGWMALFHSAAMPQHLLRPPNSSPPFLDHYAKATLIVAAACWVIGVFCGAATHRHLRGKLAILLNVAMLALTAFSVYCMMTVTY